MKKVAKALAALLVTALNRLGAGGGGCGNIAEAAVNGTTAGHVS